MTPTYKIEDDQEKKTEVFSFYEHLDELKNRVLKSLASMGIASLLVYSFIDGIQEIIIQPAGFLVFTSPADAFVARLNLTFICGFILSLPVISYQIWRFVSVGLKFDERKAILYLVPASVVLFIVGVVFAYSVALPISMKFLLSFSTEKINPMITIDKYISFAGMLLLSFGFIFEMPLIILFLVKIGIATPEFLAQKRKISIVLILIVSAILTPPDVITQLILAGPLLILYEVGIWVSRSVYKK